MSTATSTQTNNAAPAVNGYANNAFYKNAAKYLVNAIGEGVKQSLNGMDINVEFITLSVRSVAQTSHGAVTKLIARYSNARRKQAERRFHYINTTLSHA